MNVSKVVLLVDDSQTVRRMLEWTLKPSGFRTLHQSDRGRKLGQCLLAPVFLPEFLK